MDGDHRERIPALATEQTASAIGTAACPVLAFPIRSERLAELLPAVPDAIDPSASEIAGQIGRSPQQLAHVVEGMLLHAWPVTHYPAMRNFAQAYHLDSRDVKRFLKHFALGLQYVHERYGSTPDAVLLTPSRAYLYEGETIQKTGFTQSVHIMLEGGKDEVLVPPVFIQRFTPASFVERTISFPRNRHKTVNPNLSAQALDASEQMIMEGVRKGLISLMRKNGEYPAIAASEQDTKDERLGTVNLSRSDDPRVPEADREAMEQARRLFETRMKEALTALRLGSERAGWHPLRWDSERAGMLRAR